MCAYMYSEIGTNLILNIMALNKTISQTQNEKLNDQVK